MNPTEMDTGFAVSSRKNCAMLEEADIVLLQFHHDVVSREAAITPEELEEAGEVICPFKKILHFCCLK